MLIIYCDLCFDSKWFWLISFICFIPHLYLFYFYLCGVRNSLLQINFSLICVGFEFNCYVPVPTPLPISKWLVDPTRTVFYSSFHNCCIVAYSYIYVQFFEGLDHFIIVLPHIVRCGSWVLHSCILLALPCQYFPYDSVHLFWLVKPINHNEESPLTNFRTLLS